MVRFINKLSGQDMWVAEERVEEYKAAGHKLAAPVSEAPAAKPKKVTKKTTKKQG